MWLKGEARLRIDLIEGLKMSFVPREVSDELRADIEQGFRDGQQLGEQEEEE